MSDPEKVWQREGRWLHLADSRGRYTRFAKAVDNDAAEWLVDALTDRERLIADSADGLARLRQLLYDTIWDTCGCTFPAQEMYDWEKNGLVVRHIRGRECEGCAIHRLP